MSQTFKSILCVVYLWHQRLRFKMGSVTNKKQTLSHIANGTWYRGYSRPRYTFRIFSYGPTAWTKGDSFLLNFTFRSSHITYPLNLRSSGTKVAKTSQHTPKNQRFINDSMSCTDFHLLHGRNMNIYSTYILPFRTSNFFNAHRFNMSNMEYLMRRWHLPFVGKTPQAALRSPSCADPPHSL